MSETTPEALFLRWRDQRDADALASVFDRTAPALLRLARHLAPVGVEAEDLLQTTFLVALEAPGDWDSERPLVPWLAGVLGRRALHEQRRAARTPEADRLRTPSAADPVRAILEGETTELLSSALARVPERYRAVLEGRLVKDREAADLAQELGRSPSTVHVQMHRGLRLLRKVLPASLAPGTAGAAGSVSGLSAVRRTVLRAARQQAGLLTLGRFGLVPLLTGLTLMTLAGSLAWLMTHGGGSSDDALARSELERTAKGVSEVAALVAPPAALESPMPAGVEVTEATSPGEAAEPVEEPETKADDGESGVIRWWVVGRVIAPPNVDHGARAWEGTKVRIEGPGVGMEFGVVRPDGNFRQPMLSPPPWEAVEETASPADRSFLVCEVSHPEFLPGTHTIAMDERIGDTLSVELELLPAGRVRGAATDATGADLPACFTQVFPLVGEQLGAPAIADRGRERPSSYDMLAAPGDAVVAVALGGLRPGGSRALILEGTTQTLAPIVLESGATLTGLVRDISDPSALVEARLETAGTSQPLGPLEVVWHRGRLEWSLVKAYVGRDGEFVLPGLVPGARYRITYGGREVFGIAGAARVEL